MRMRPLLTLVAGFVVCATVASAQMLEFELPRSLEAGAPFSITTSGNGKGVFYLVGPGQVVRREIQLGEKVVFSPGEVHSAGHYIAILAGDDSTRTAEMDVTASMRPATLSFLAKPSRLSVDQPNAISGVVYIFDAFRNLLLEPKEVSFELSGTGAAPQTRTVSSHNGVAWVRLNSAPKAGSGQFQARVDNVTEKRIVQEVSGEPCNLRMSAHKSGQRVAVETAPLLDCRGNAVPDGTIVTFKETYNGEETTVDVPLKRGVARTELPAQNEGLISVATGVVMGNEIRWKEGQ